MVRKQINKNKMRSIFIFLAILVAIPALANNLEPVPSPAPPHFYYIKASDAIACISRCIQNSAVYDMVNGNLVHVHDPTSQLARARENTHALCNKAHLASDKVAHCAHELRDGVVELGKTVADSVRGGTHDMVGCLHDVQHGFHDGMASVEQHGTDLAQRLATDVATAAHKVSHFVKDGAQRVSGHTFSEARSWALFIVCVTIFLAFAFFVSISIQSPYN